MSYMFIDRAKFCGWLPTENSTPRRVNPFDKVTFLIEKAKGGALQFGTPAAANERKKYKGIYNKRTKSPISLGRLDIHAV